MKKEKPLWFVATGVGLGFGLILFFLFEILFMLGGEAHLGLAQRFGLWMICGVVIGVCYAALSHVQERKK